MSYHVEGEDLERWIGVKSDMFGAQRMNPADLFSSTSRFPSEMSQHVLYHNCDSSVGQIIFFFSNSIHWLSS